MGLKKFLNRQNKAELKEKNKRKDDFLAEFKVLSDKYGLDITAELKYTPGGIIPMPVIIENKNKRIETR